MSDGSTGLPAAEGQLESIEPADALQDVETSDEPSEVPKDGADDTPFYFDGISLEHQEAVRAVGEELETQIHRHKESVLAIGKNACEIKRILGHGRFKKWVEAKGFCSLSTMERFMNAWARFGHLQDRIGTLRKTDLCDLASPCVPESFRESVLADVEQGRTFEPGEIRRGIKVARGLNDPAKTVTRSKKTRAKTGSRSKGNRVNADQLELSETLDKVYSEESACEDMLADFIIQKICDEPSEFLRLYPKTDGRKVLRTVALKFQYEER